MPLPVGSSTPAGFGDERRTGSQAVCEVLMCGILGYSGLETAPDMSAALTSIVHRGPDQSGYLVDEATRVGFAQARLSIIDLSEAGRQPMRSQCNRFSIVYNGEIYNHRELRADLEKAGHGFRGNSDTEVLLTLLSSEGLSCLPALNGIFAFALFDHETGRVTLVRDRLGIKPLYIHTDDDGIRFSSEIKGIVALGGDLDAPDVEALGRYVSFLWCPGTKTPSTKVRRLAPGEAINLHDGKIENEWLWFPPQRSCSKRQVGADQAADELREVVRAAVHRQMISDVPVGAFLSGGLDSSAVVAFAREKQPDLRCFTIETGQERQEGVTDDLPYARRVADHLDVPLEVVTVTSEQLVAQLQEMVFQLDEPLADPATVNVLFISQLARRSGCTVLLSGTGGDDLFTGYRRHTAIGYRRYWSWLPISMRRGLGNATGWLDKRKPLLRKAAKFLETLHHDGDEAIVSYFRWTGRNDVLALFRPELRERLSQIDPAMPMFAHLAELDSECDDIDRMLALEQRFFLADHNLTYTDKMSMAAGVETRVPLLDNEVVSFAATLPNTLKQHGSEGKWIFKKAMEPILPKSVIYRPKTGFGAPLRYWINNELRPVVDDLLSCVSLRSRGLFDPTAVETLVARTRRGEIDGSYTVFSLLCIELWFRKFVDEAQHMALAGTDPDSADTKRDNPRQ